MKIQQKEKQKGIKTRKTRILNTCPDKMQLCQN